VQTPRQVVLINRLAKITEHPILQSADSLNLIGIGSNEDRRNRVPCLDEVPEKFNAGHRRHVDIGDQAGRFPKTGGCEEIRCRRENGDRIAQRSHEPSHGLAKRLVVIDDRDQ